MAEKMMLSPAVNLPSEYYAAIGEVAARWSWLEWQFGVIIRICLRLGKKEGRLVTVGMAITPKAHIVRGFAGKWIGDPRLQQKMRSLARDVLDMLDARNEAVHGVYGYADKEPEAMRRLKVGSAEERILPPAPKVTVEDIKRCGRRLHELQERAQYVTKRLKALPPVRAGR